MSCVLVVGEDALCCALGERLVGSALPRWNLAGPSVNKKGVTTLQRDLDRYIKLARYVQPVLCIADTDRNCALAMRSTWLPAEVPAGFMLRFAVTEAESWLLADRRGFSEALKVPLNNVPRDADEVPDPKRKVLSLVSNSRNRRLREEMISASDVSKPGSGYNLHLCAFVREHWDPVSARTGSQSLDRAFRRLQEWSL